MKGEWERETIKGDEQLHGYKIKLRGAFEATGMSLAKGGTQDGTYGRDGTYVRGWQSGLTRR